MDSKFQFTNTYLEMLTKPRMTFREYRDMHTALITHCDDHHLPPPTKHWIRQVTGVYPPGYNCTLNDTTMYIIEDMKKFQAAKLKYGF